MKVLLAANVSPSSGGVANHIQCLSRELEQLGVTVEQMWRLGRRYPGAVDTLAFSASLVRRARQPKVDIVHTHGADGVVAHRAVRSTSGSVMTSHGDERTLWGIERDASRRGEICLPARTRVSVPLTRTPLFTSALRSADAVIALHEEEAKSFSRERSGPVVVIPNGWTPLDHRSDRPIEGRLLYVGTWNWRKGSDLLPAVFAELRDRRPSTHLVLAGPPPSARLDFRDEDREAVDVCGWVDRARLSEAVGAADVLVITSRFEGLPLAALDALAHGLPVVGFDLPGVRELPGTYLVDPRQGPAGLADALLHVVSDRAERNRLSADARQGVGPMTWSAAAAATAALYESVLRQRRAQA